MLVTLLTKVFLPLSLAIIMFGMGMTLVVSDFTRIFKFPKAVIIGLTNQLIFLPLIGFSLAILFGLSEAIALGFIIIAACPGGPTSNLITQLCKGNIALSVTLTAIASFASIITIPVILTFALEYFNIGQGTKIELPVLSTILQIMVITVIPVAIGMFVNKKKPEFAKKMESPMRKASTIIFIVIFILVIGANYDLILDALKSAGLATLLLNLGTMSLGFLTSRLLRLNLKDSISITVESGIQNGTLGFVIATTILNNMEMSLPIGIYSIWMFISGGLLIFLFSRKGTTA